MSLKLFNGVLGSSCLYTSNFLRTYSVSHFQIWYLLISTPGMWLSAFCLDIARNRDLITLQGSPFYFWNVLNVSKLLTVLRIEVFLELAAMGCSSCLEDYYIPESSLRLSKPESFIMNLHSLHFTKVP